MIIAALMLLIAILYVVEIIDFGFASFIIPHLLIAEGEEIISSYKKMYIFGGVTALITSYLLKTRYSE